MWNTISGVLIFVVTFGGAAWEHKETLVSEGGTLVVAVTLDGQVPNPRGYYSIALPVHVHYVRIPDVQGWRPLQPFNVCSAGKFRTVVLSLEGIEKGTALTQATTT